MPEGKIAEMRGWGDAGTRNCKRPRDAGASRGHSSSPHLLISSSPHGSSNATYSSPAGEPSLPPAAEITTYCFPLTRYVLGEA